LAAKLLCSLDAAPASGWLHWRGPHQNGTSDETGLIEDITLGGEGHLWTFDMAGRGEAVIADGRVYAWGYQGTGPDLREYLTCLDEATGKVLWQHGFNDFLSDIVYSRYSIGSATVDAETGNIYLMSTAGEMTCFNRNGKVIWQHSMMERYGMLTFPNGRRGAAVIDGDLVIHHCITSYWGADGPARDRFFAFNKHDGKLVWASTPGTPPKDSSFCSPVLGYYNNKRVLYAGTGCGNLVAINARNGILCGAIISLMAVSIHRSYCMTTTKSLPSTARKTSTPLRSVAWLPSKLELSRLQANLDRRS